jgi:hypothetical protein
MVQGVIGFRGEVWEIIYRVERKPSFGLGCGIHQKSPFSSKAASQSIRPLKSLSPTIDREGTPR